MQLLKELSLSKIAIKMFGTFSLHPLYAALEELAFTVDPKKNVTEKGKNLFPGDKQTGIDFMRLLLESLIAWGNKFPNNSKKEPTKFKKTLNKLQEDKVTLPMNLVYYPPQQKKTERAETPQGIKEGPGSPTNAKLAVADPPLPKSAAIEKEGVTPGGGKPKEQKDKHFGNFPLT